MKLIKFIFGAGIILCLVAAVFALMTASQAKAGYDEVAAWLLRMFGCWCGLIAVEWMGGMEEEAEKQTQALEAIQLELSRRAQPDAANMDRLKGLTEELRDDVRELKETTEELRDALAPRKPTYTVRVEESVERTDPDGRRRR